MGILSVVSNSLIHKDFTWAKNQLSAPDTTISGSSVGLRVYHHTICRVSLWVVFLDIFSNHLDLGNLPRERAFLNSFVPDLH